MSRLPRAELVLPFVILLGAIVLAASEFMTAFEFTPPGGEPLREVSSADRHNYSMLLLAAGAVIAMAVAIVTGARPAAYAVAGFGAVALLIFLVADLPDAGKLGDLSDPIRGFASARAEPQEGFWLEAIGAVTLAIGGGAFATLSSEQLQALTRRPRRGGDDRAEHPRRSEGERGEREGASRPRSSR